MSLSNIQYNWKPFKQRLLRKNHFKNGKAVFKGLIDTICHRAIKGFLGDGIYTLFFMVYSRLIH